MCFFFSFIITTINVGGLLAVCILWDGFHILQSDDFGLWFCSFNWIVIRCCFDVCICIWADVRVCMWWNAYLSSSLDKPSIHFDYPIFDAHKFCGSLSVLTDFEMHRAIGANLLLRDTHTQNDDKTNEFRKSAWRSTAWWIFLKLHIAVLIVEWVIYSLFSNEFCKHLFIGMKCLLFVRNSRRFQILFCSPVKCMAAAAISLHIFVVSQH